jgi:hypothetical protein
MRTADLSNIDSFVKSRKSPKDCHSGLSGIVFYQHVVWQHDSRQAGMTTFYEFIDSLPVIDPNSAFRNPQFKIMFPGFP